MSSLDSSQIHETIESINQLKTQRDFMLSFSNNPQDFIQDWLKSQSRDLKVLNSLASRAAFHSKMLLPSLSLFGSFRTLP